ncbi:enoyl-CoA hydratase-related protein [Maritalea sp.]|jgi:enoyl-CoA hydratase|uniref:enoyl-CoA hydratase-related protein n=1 Tax=Maritalea sp. TaxID=2003361 RepID=UPI0039E322A2
MRPEPVILLEHQDGVATITLNRPDQRNAFDVEMCNALRHAVDEVEQNPSIQCTILRANGPVFCAGMDLKAFIAGAGDNILFGEYGFAGFVKRQRTKPVIAAVEGAALAGGFELMLACDMVIAGQSVKFGLPEAKLGLVAAGGGAIRLGQRVPRVIANQILLTGKPFSASDALAWGLINQIAADGTSAQIAHELAQEIAQNAPLSLLASLALSDLAAKAAETALWVENDLQMANIGKTADAKEGPTAFIEKRAPVWLGH